MVLAGLGADGQRDIGDIMDPAPGTIVTPLFGGCEFVPLAKAMEDYRTWDEMIDDWNADDDPNGSITLRAGDPPVSREIGVAAGSRSR